MNWLLNIVVGICLMIFSTGTFAQNDSHHKPLVINKITDKLYVFTTYGKFNNSYFPSNGLIAVADNEVILIDTPWDTSQALPLLDTIKVRFNKPVTTCISTHFHDDRTVSIPFYKQLGIKTFASIQTDSLCEKRGEHRPEFTFQHDTIFRFDGISLTTFYPGKGHTEDNIIVWSPDEKLLYGGCFIKSTESKSLGNLADADPEAWLVSIEQTIANFQDAEWVIPGHQNGTSKEALFHTRRLLQQYLTGKK